MTIIAISTLVALSGSFLQTDLFIDPTITGSDRHYLENLMQNLDVDERENVVVFFEDDRILSNRPEMGLGWSHPQFLGNNLYMNSEGEQLAGIPFDINPDLIPSIATPGGG